MTALELLQNLNLLDETERIEAKRASESGKSLLEAIEGGHHLLVLSQ